jgi:hypothetical protein
MQPNEFTLPPFELHSVGQLYEKMVKQGANTSIVNTNAIGPVILSKDDLVNITLRALERYKLVWVLEKLCSIACKTSKTEIDSALFMILSEPALYKCMKENPSLDAMIDMSARATEFHKMRNIILKILNRNTTASLNDELKTSQDNNVSTTPIEKKEEKETLQTNISRDVLSQTGDFQNEPHQPGFFTKILNTIDETIRFIDNEVTPTQNKM